MASKSKEAARRAEQARAGKERKDGARQRGGEPRQQEQARAEAVPQPRRDDRAAVAAAQARSSAGASSGPASSGPRPSSSEAVARAQQAAKNPVHKNLVRTTDGSARILFNKEKGKAASSRPEDLYGMVRPGLRLSEKSADRVHGLFEQGWQTKAPKKGNFNTRVVGVDQIGVQHLGPGYHSGLGRDKWQDPGPTSITLYQKQRGKDGAKGGKKGADGGRGRGESGGPSPYAQTGSSSRPTEPSTLGGASAATASPPSFGNAPTYESAGEPGYNGGIGYRQGPADTSVNPIGAAGSDGFIRTHWDTSPESAINYADRLGQFNRSNIDYLGGVGQQASRQMGSYLDAFARSVPRAPDTSDGYGEVLDFLERANRRLYGED